MTVGTSGPLEASCGITVRATWHSEVPGRASGAVSTALASFGLDRSRWAVLACWTFGAVTLGLALGLATISASSAWCANHRPSRAEMARGASKPSEAGDSSFSARKSSRARSAFLLCHRPRLLEPSSFRARYGSSLIKRTVAPSWAGNWLTLCAT